MFEPRYDKSPPHDARPLWAWVVAVVLLQALPWMEVESLFGWQVVQDPWWPAIAMGLALPLLFVFAGLFWVADRVGRRR